jgi:type III secretion protein J
LAGTRPPTAPPPTAALLASLALLALTACSQEEIVHGLEESQANQVLVALDEDGMRAEKRREEGSEGTWRVEVASSEAPRAQRLLAERELPRPRPPGFGEVFGKGSIVPTPAEERALYLHALSGELARSVEAIDGVVEARVHLALPPADSLRPEPVTTPRAAVLVKVRPGARSRLEPLAPGIQALVAGAVAGLDATAVSVVVAEAAPASRTPDGGAPGRRRSVLLALAGVAASLALALPSLALASSHLDLRRFLRRFVRRAP